ncbi:MAG: IS110 family transposase [Candidatus Cloacimonetes bacterium]|nr:IS110 family transposase [Candidatus Cloacimonadota bacterium]
MQTIIGLDVAKDTLAVALWQAEQPLAQSEFSNTKTGFRRLQRWLHRRIKGPVHVCMEATGRYWEHVADFLVAQDDYTVSVVNPARIKKYAESQLSRNKTDRLDAAMIADFCRTQQPAAWTPPPPAVRELQTLVRHLQDLQADQQRQRNRLHALQYAAQPAPTVTTQLQQQIDFLAAQIAEVKRALQDHIDRHPDLKQARDLLETIQGIGPLTAAKLLAEYGDMSQFSDVRQVVAFAGLNPAHYHSGTSVRGKPAISKMGRPALRAALFMPAVVAKSCNPRLAAFAARLEARGLRPMEIVVAVMRKLLHFAFGVLKSGRPYDASFGLSQPAQT